MTTPSFEDELLAMANNAELHKFPHSYYDPDGDCAEVLMSNESYVAHRVDRLLTIYVSRSNPPELVGCLVKGIRAMVEQTLKDCPGFKYDIEGTSVRLERLFTARLWSLNETSDDSSAQTYKDVREKFGSTEADFASV